MRLKLAFLALTLLPLWSCHQSRLSEELYGLPGTWLLRKMTYPAGYERHYPQDRQHVCLIIGGDTTLYQSRFNYTESGVVVLAGDVEKSRIEPAGDNEYRILRNGAMRPLTVLDDTTIVIQLYGVQYTWTRDRQMGEQCVREICNIVSNANDNPDGEPTQYVISTSERELKYANYRLLCSLLLLLFLLATVCIYALRTYRRKKYIERRLSQIREELSFRPRQVAQVMQGVADEFFASDYYRMLRQKIDAGKVLSPGEWKELEKHLKSVFPDFMRHFSALCQLSVTEWRVCLLIRLRFTPTEIAGTLAKETSTISIIRSRLYRKVFGKNGSSKDWDNFILSL